MSPNISKPAETPFKTSPLLRGGETAVTNVRMLFQLIRRFTLIGLMLGIPVSALLLAREVTERQGYLTFVHYYAAAAYALYHNPAAIIPYTQPDGSTAQVEISAVLNNAAITATAVRFVGAVVRAIARIFIVGGAWVTLILGYAYFRGKKLSRRTFIRGGQIAAQADLRAMVIAENQSQKIDPYLIAGMPYPAYAESKNTIMVGAQGVGKTSVIRDLIQQVRDRGDRAIIYDKMGVFVSGFYDPSKDIILNPLDQRAPRWSIFGEIDHATELDTVAEAIIPTQHGQVDPFWFSAARIVFSEVTRELWQSGERSNRRLVETLLTVGLERLQEIASRTYAASLVDERAEKMALSVMAMLTTNIKPMTYLPDNGPEFSIRRWIEDETQSGILFVSSRGNVHASLRPLISTWIEIAVNTMLSLRQNRDRKIWYLLDELPTLNYVPSLASAAAEGRQFGGALLLGLQSYPQLRQIYGNDGADAIGGVCRTRLLFATPDSVTARWAADSLGRVQYDEIREGLSYGFTAMRDGITINTDRRDDQVVTDTEIMRLDDMTAYLIFPGSFPVARIDLPPYRRVEPVAEPFIMNPSITGRPTNLKAPPTGTSKPRSGGKPGGKTRQLSPAEHDLLVGLQPDPPSPPDASESAKVIPFPPKRPMVAPTLPPVPAAPADDPTTTDDDDPLAIYHADNYPEDHD